MDPPWGGETIVALHFVFEQRLFDFKEAKNKNGWNILWDGEMAAGGVKKLKYCEGNECPSFESSQIFFRPLPFYF